MTLPINSDDFLSASVWCAPGEAFQKEEMLIDQDIFVQALVWDARNEHACVRLGKAQGLARPSL